MTLSCRSNPPGRLSVLWSQLLRRRNALTHFIISDSLSDSQFPLGAPLPPAVSPRYPFSVHFPNPRPPQDILFANPVSGGVPFSFRTPPGAPYSSRQSTLCIPSACLEATHRRTRPPPSQYPRHTQHRHPEPLWPRRRPRGTKGWDLTQERPSGPGARGCRSEPALSMSTTGENLHLCGADNRRRRLFPKVHSRTHVI